jgi:UDP-N-acetylmuramoyl-tripeptide--D-alanyl-D-alanine ligase
VRRFSNATFIGVTGSSTKSTTTALLAQMLSGHGKVRPQILKNQLRDILKTVRRHRWGEKFVVAEVGTAGKGQIRPMADVLRPDVAIVTLIGIEHYTQFRSREAVAEEKGDLVEAVPPDGLVVLNADDEFAMSMASRTKARIVTFGRSERADYRVLSVRTSFPEGSVVEIAWAGGTLTVSTRLLGEHFWLPTVAATAAAIELGVPPDEVVRQAASFGALNNRWELYETADGPTFILDTAKAPNETLGLAFDAIGKLSAPSKTVVLGSISDFPGNPRPKYREAYRGARAVADRVIFIGDHSHRSGASDEDRATGRFLEMQEPRQIYDHLRATAKKGDLVLLKSSQGLHLERVALAFNMDVQCWQTTCGRKTGCRSCGLFGVPFEKHSTAANPPPAEPQVLGP